MVPQLLFKTLYSINIEDSFWRSGGHSWKRHDFVIGVSNMKEFSIERKDLLGHQHKSALSSIHCLRCEPNHHIDEGSSISKMGFI